MLPTTFMMNWMYGTGYVFNIVIIRQDEKVVVMIRENEEVAEDGAHVAIAPASGNENHNAEEIGEDRKLLVAMVKLSFLAINGVMFSLGRIFLHISGCLSAAL